MATKAQDRKALEQIKKILAGLDGDSYVLQAMDGMVEDAEENIENDFWNSYRSRYEYKDAECDRYEKELEKANERAKEAERKQQMAEGLLQTKTEEADKWFSKYNAEKSKYEAALQETQKGVAAAKTREQELELEVIELKAKLYDMMVGA